MQNRLLSLAFLIVFFLAIIGLFFALAFSNGSLEASDLVDYVAAVIGAVSLTATFAVAVLAINAFANSREINELTHSAKTLHNELQHELENANKLLSVMPSVILELSDHFAEDEKHTDDPNTARGKEKRKRYINLLHARLFFRLISTQSDEEKIGICRHIIGTSKEHNSREILEHCIEELQKISNQERGNKRVISALVKEAENLLPS